MQTDPSTCPSSRYSFLPVEALLLLVLFAGLVGLPGASEAQELEQDVSLRIVDVLEAPEQSTREGTVVMEVEILSGRFAGEIHRMEQHQWGHPWYDYPLREGRQFTARVFADNGEINRVVLEEVRSDWKLLVIFLLVSVALFAVGRWEGFVGLLSTMATLGMIYFLFFPVILHRTEILLVGMVICVLTILITVGLVMRGANPTWPAIGALLVVLSIITGFSIVALDWLNLEAHRAHHSRLLLAHLHRSDGLSIASLWQLVTVGIVLSTLGAIMDVAVVISSTIDEITRDQVRPSFRNAFRSGMNVGREILSTMVNTLIFAYLGILIPYVLAVEMFDLSWVMILNLDFVGIELLRVAVGLVSMALIVPVTSLLSAAWSMWCYRP